MGISSDGILAYGYDLGGDDGEWKIEEAGEYGEWTPSWLGEDEDEEGPVEAAELALLAAAGFTETDYEVAGYFDRKREAEARVGVEMTSYCSGDYPMYVLSAHAITVGRGSVKEIDFAALEVARVEQEWDAKLTAALGVLGMTPKQATPKWLLVSYMG